MKRNSTTIWIVTFGTTTPLPWVNGAPSYTGFNEPTLSILINGYEANKNNIVVIPDVVPAPIVPTVREIDARRLRIALSRLGYLTSVEALVAQADAETKIQWEFATFIKENFPLVQTITAALNLTKANVDAIFDLALTLI